MHHCHKKLTTISTLNKATNDIVELDEMKLLDVRLHEEQCVNSSFNANEIVSDSTINLHRHQKRKLREKHRNALLEGIPVDNACMFRHYFSNKPMVCVLFKIDPNKKVEQVVQGIKMATKCMPVFVTMYQKKKVKECIKLTQCMPFTKMSSKVNYLLATMPEVLNLSTTMLDEHEFDLKNQMQLAQDIEDGVLLEDSLLGNKGLHRGKQTLMYFFKEDGK